MTMPAVAPALENRDPLNHAYRKIAWHIVPLLTAAFTVSYIDRVNVGFAQLQMGRAVGFSEEVFGFGAGAFFLTYVLCQLPANMVLQRVGVRRWIFAIMLAWGLLSASFVFVSGPISFVLLRLLLGAAEAGFYPAMIFYLSAWFPAQRRATMVALFMSAIPIAGILGNPLSGWIMKDLDGRAHLAGWQWMFALEAAPALLFAVLLLLNLSDTIDDADWLSAEERSLVGEDLAADRGAATPIPRTFGASLRDRRIYLLSGIYFSIVLSQYGITFWLPTLLNSAGAKDPLRIGLLSALPFLTAVIAMNLVGRSADRHRERRWHTIVPMLAAVAGLLAVIVVHGVPATRIALCVAAAGALAATCNFWSLPTAFLSGTAAAAGLAMINSIGNFAGFVSPSLIGFIRTQTHSNFGGMVALSIALAIGVGAVLSIPSRLVNR